MRFIKIINIAASCALLFTSCVEQGQHGAEGYLDLSVTCDKAVQIVPVSKAGEQPQTIGLTVYDTKDNIVHQWDDASQLTEPVQMNTGRYRAVATSGEDLGPAVFDSPFYRGEKDFTIKANVITTADLVCRLASVKVTAEISSEIQENFDYSLTVSNGVGELVFDGQNLQREGYFSVTQSLQWTLELINASNEKFVFTDTYNDVTASQHYKLAFSIAEDDNGPLGASDIRILVDDSLNPPKYHDVVVVIDKSAPSVSGPDQINRYMADITSGALIELNSGLPYTMIRLAHDNQALTEAGVPAEVDIMTMTDFSSLEQAGIHVAILDQSGNAEQSVSPATKIVKFDFTSLANKLGIGNYALRLTSANETGKEAVKDVNINVLSSMGQLILNPWAKFVYFKGFWLSDNMPQLLSVQYRKSGAAQWNDMDASLLLVDESTKKVSGFICGLSDLSSYELRLVASTETGAVTSCQTEQAYKLYNMSFDDWCDENGGAPYASNADPKIWDTANGGTKIMSLYPTTQEKNDVISGSAVRMESAYGSLMGVSKFAAGNIYTGKFKEVSVSPMGAILDWGVPIYGRPLGLKGHYKYAPVPINHVGSGYEKYKGESDRCQIQAALFDWTAPFEVNSGYNQFVEFGKSNKTVMAHNEIVDYSTDGKWVSFTMYIAYRNITTRPSYVIVSACASRFGDYFTGGEGSVMLVDEFEFVYDPMELNETDRNAFFAMFK